MIGWLLLVDVVSDFVGLESRFTSARIQHCVTGVDIPVKDL
jgi:hypothetical protein